MSLYNDKVIISWLQDANSLLDLDNLSEAQKKKLYSIVSMFITNPMNAEYITENPDILNNIKKLASQAVQAPHKIYANSSNAKHAWYNDVDAMNSIASDPEARNWARNDAEMWSLISNNSMATAKIVCGYAGLNPADYADMNAVAADSTAMDAVANSETAMNVIANSENAMDAILSSQTAIIAIKNSSNLNAISKLSPYAPTLNEEKVAKLLVSMAGQDPSAFSTLEDVWNNDTVRQNIWTKPASRLIFGMWLDYFDWAGDTSKLSTDADAGYLVHTHWYGSSSGGWQTQIQKDDGKRYIAFIKYHADGVYDWYNGEIANADGSEAIQFGGGSNQTKWGKKMTLNGLRIRFYSNGYHGSTASYADSWYIAVED